MSAVEPFGAQESPDRIAPPGMQRPSTQMAAGALPSAAEIWSPGVQAARRGKPAEQIAPEKRLYGAESADRSRIGSLWQNNTWQKRRLAQDRTCWPPRRLSLALQGGGSFGAFTWGVLERLLEEPNCEIDAISGASVGAVNGVLLASGFVEGGREGRADATQAILEQGHGRGIVPLADVDRRIFTGRNLRYLRSRVVFGAI